MNWNAHILRLGKIRAKLERGERPTKREVVYVRLLWERVKAYIRPLVLEIERTFGMPVSKVAERLQAPEVQVRIQERQSRVIAERDAARQAMMQMHEPRRM